MVKAILKITVLAIALSTILLIGIDREVARQDWLDGKLVKGCLFDFNCDYYNEM